MIKPKPWAGGALKGLWQVTLKIDGVRALRQEDGSYHSRADKPLHNLQLIEGDDVEVFLGTWEETVSRVRSHSGDPVPATGAYALDPLDPRLQRGWQEDPGADLIQALMQEVVDEGYEGLVLRQGDKWLKVKPTENYDVAVTGVQPGAGKHTGRMGALLTDKGKVGTGFSDALREEAWEVGEVIEVACMGLTPAGKFRHPRFVRRRFDKAA